MLKLTSRFVLEFLPYLFSGLVAVVLVPGLVYSLLTVTLPGVFYSEPHEMAAMVAPNAFGGGETVLEFIRQDFEVFDTKPDVIALAAKAANANSVNR